MGSGVPDGIVVLGVDVEGIETVVQARKAVDTLRKDVEKPVTITFDGDASKLVKQVEKAKKSVSTFTYDLKALTSGKDDLALGALADDLDLSEPLAATTKGAVNVRREIDAVKNVLRLVNPQFSQMGEYAGGAAKALGEGSGLTLAAAGAGAALVVAATATYKFGSAIVSTIDNVDTLKAALSDAQRRSLAPTIASMEDAARAGHDLDASFAETQIRLASGFTRDVEDFREALSGVVDVANQLDASTDGGFSSAIEQGLVGELPYTLQALIPLVHAYGEEVAAAKRKADNATTFPATANGPYQQGYAPGDVPPFLRPQTDTRNEVQRFYDEQVKALQAAKADKAKFDSVMAGFTGEWTMINGTPVGQAGVDSVMDELDAQDQLAKAIHDTTQARIADQAAALNAAEQRKEWAEQEKAFYDDIHAKTVQASREEAQGALQIASQFTSAIGDLYSNIAAASGESALDQWRVQHAAAIAQGAINIPLAFMEGLTQGGYVTAGIYAGLAAVQEAAIIATPPPKIHHYGGVLAPDEVAAGGYIGLAGEVQAVVSRKAVEAMGGASGVSAWAQGSASAPDGTTYVLVDSDGMRRKLRRFAAPSTMSGRARMGLR